MNEPSVWDYLLSRLMPWKYKPVALPPAEEAESPHSEVYALGGEADKPAAAVSESGAAWRADALVEEAGFDISRGEEAMGLKAPPSPLWPWLLAIGLACLGQWLLAPHDGSPRAWAPGAFAILLAMAMAGWAAWRTRWGAEEPCSRPAALPGQKVTINLTSLAMGVLLMLIDYVLFISSSMGESGEPHFTFLNLAVGVAAVVFMGHAFWGSEPLSLHLGDSEPKLRKKNRWLSILAGVTATGLVLFFRLYRLGDTPPEMNSDHAEKILDILRVLDGQYLIFFATNGGREALIFYLGAALHKLTGLPLGFLALKIVSVSIGLAAQPFIYLLGKEFGGRRVGWLAFVLSGIAYWPNVVSRFGLRLPFYIFFTAATLYFVVHGLRHMQRRSFIWAGVCLGLGVYGYTPDRLLPLSVLAAFGLAALPALRRRGQAQAEHALLFNLTGLLAIMMISLAVFMPLLSYIMVAPDQFLFRTVTRIGPAEAALPGSPLQIFIHNTVRSLGMFSWSSGVIWPISIPDYPALGAVAGGLFYLGLGLMALRLWRGRRPLDAFLLLSIPLLQLPSTLALAFPNENPNLYRSGGALVPAFILAATALHQAMRAIESRVAGRWGKIFAWILALSLLAGAAIQDYQWVFERYRLQYLLSAQNTSDLGRVAADFIHAGGSPDDVYVMGYPYWVDARLVAINAGYPERNFGLFIDGLPALQSAPGAASRARLFMLNPQDEAAHRSLQAAFPQGWFESVRSSIPGKDFDVFFSIPK